jgi:hypothetical protein
MPYRSIWTARNAVLILSLTFAMASPARAGAEDVSATESPARVSAGDVFFRGFDAVIVRPVSAVRMLVGAVLFFPLSELSLIGGLDNAREGFDVFVATPARYTFTRPLGDF